MNPELAEFAKAVAVPNVKNTIQKISTSTDLITVIPEKACHSIAKSIAYLDDEIYSEANIKKIISALKTYQKLKNELLYHYIAVLWIKVFPICLPHLRNIRNICLSNVSNDKKKEIILNQTKYVLISTNLRKIVNNIASLTEKHDLRTTFEEGEK